MTVSISRFYLMRGTADGPIYLLDVVADDGAILALWTEDRDLACRFDRRAVAEMVRGAIIAAEHEAGRSHAVALIPEA